MAADKVRESVIAGSWYPGSGEELRSLLASFFEKAKLKAGGDPRALIAPHAGYAYSGEVAAYAYSEVEGKKFRQVFVLAPAHTYPLMGASVPDFSFYETPLGRVRVSHLASELRDALPFISFCPEAHIQEHALEIQLPFLQYVLGDFELVPVLVGNLSGEEIDSLAGLIKKHLGEDSLVVASSDLSHFHSYEEAVSLDSSCMDSIVALDLGKVSASELCGIFPVLVLMSLAGKMDWKPRLLKYLNSGDVTGDMSRVVGYSAIGFYPAAVLGEEEGRELLGIARKSLESYVLEGERFEPEECGPALEENGASFVTLEKGGELRGCIGHLEASQPLCLDVRDNAISAASQDPRFNPVSPGELSGITIEVSVLTSPSELRVKDPREYLERLRPGVDGVILECQGRGATYLPQVWESIPDAEDFLSSLCAKAGLPRASWRGGDAKVYTYEVKAFKE